MANLLTKMPTILKEIFRKALPARSKAKRQLWKPQLSRCQVSKVVSCYYHEITRCRGFIDDNDGHGDDADDMSCTI
jgi:hypothetical protein